MRTATRCPRMLVPLALTMALAGALPAEPVERPYQYHSAMPAYWKFREDTESVAPRVERFRAAVVEPNREAFRAVAAGWLNDASLGRLLRGLDGQSKAFRRVEAEFPGRMDKAWRRFAESTPDLKPGADVYLLPAPRFAVGGSVRPLGERDAVIFGAEEIALTLGSKTGFDVLVHHEMTHLYHQQVNPEIRRMVAEVYLPPYAAGGAKLYQVVWLEGLAVYRSRALNPTAPDREVLVSASLAADVKAGWPRIGAEVREHLDSTKKEDIDAFLFGGNTGGRFPRRTGYYVGMLIAERLAQKHTFPELCRLAGPQLRSEVEAALRELEKTDIRRE